jgi:putative RecB family exonuclease
VIERLHLALAKGQVPPLDKVLRRFRLLWDEHFDAERVRIVRSGLRPGYYISNGERCLTNFYRRSYPFDDDETIAVEERVRFDLDSDAHYKMQGVIDRIVRARDGAIEVHDYKTGQRVPKQAQLDEDRQLALYQMGLAPRFGHEKPYRLVWHYLLKDQVKTSTRTPEQIEALRSETIALIDRIRATTEFPARPSALCDWCEFAVRCPKGPGVSADAPADLPAAPAASEERAPEEAPGDETAPPAAASPADPAKRGDAEDSAPAPAESGQLSLL